MTNSDALRRLLRSLCHGTCWKYAAFWKIEHGNSMVLTWEDAYIDNIKSNVLLETSSWSGLFGAKKKPGIVSFDRDSDARFGNSSGCPIEVAIEDLSCHTFLLGEGIVGRVALGKKHHWILADKFNTQLFPNCPEECQVQFAAGIKTILFVPVVPLGVVQLGSLDMMKEDPSVVVHVKDLFSSIQHNLATSGSLVSRLDHVDPYTSITTPLMPNILAPSALSNLLDPISPFSAKKDVTLNFGKPSNHETPTASSQFQADLSISQNVLDQIIGMDTGLDVDTNTWKAMPSKSTVDPAEKLRFLDQPVSTDYVIENVISNVQGFEDELNVLSAVNQKFAHEQPAIQNSFMRDGEHYDLCFIENRKGQELEGALFQGAEPIMTGGYLNFPFHSELHKVLGLDSLEGYDGHVCNAITPKPGQMSNSAASYPIEVGETYEHSTEKMCQWFTEDSSREHILDAIIANLRFASEVSVPIRSGSNSSGNFPDSCLTQNIADNVFGLDGSGPRYHSSFPVDESLISSPTGSSSKSIVSLLIHDEQINNTMDQHDKQDLQSSQSNKRRGRSSGSHGPRPRDRQLIQDRLTELRDLIPNGEKCSIDVLLDRTVNHMLFLRSIPERAGKLRHSASSKAMDCATHFEWIPKLDGEHHRLRKIKLEVNNKPVAQTSQNGATWAYEMGSQAQPCPLVVENLDQPGQMLVEMLCKEYGLFLEIAQVIKCMRLTILKSVLESRSNNLWAHFIVEASRGFHRMDILLPLMQLLQRN